MKNLVLILTILALFSGCNKLKQIEETNDKSNEVEVVQIDTNTKPIFMACSEDEGWAPFYKAVTRNPEKTFSEERIKDIYCPISQTVVILRKSIYNIKCYEVTANPGEFYEDIVAVEGGKTFEYQFNCLDYKPNPVDYENPGSGVTDGGYECTFDILRTKEEFGTDISDLKRVARGIVGNLRSISFSRKDLLPLVEAYLCENNINNNVIVKCSYNIKSSKDYDSMEKFEGRLIDYEPEKLYFKVEAITCDNHLD